MNVGTNKCIMSKKKNFILKYLKVNNKRKKSNRKMSKGYKQQFRK